MSRVVAVIVAMFAFVMCAEAINPVAEIGRARAREDARRQLMQMYDGRYSAVEMMLQEQLADYEMLCKIPETAEDVALLDRLLELHYPNFTGILRLYKTNKESYSRVMAKD